MTEVTAAMTASNKSDLISLEKRMKRFADMEEKMKSVIRMNGEVKQFKGKKWKFWKIRQKWKW